MGKHDVPRTADEVAQLLPLPPVTFHVLLALADEDRHGYAIIQEVATRRTPMTPPSAASSLDARYRGAEPLARMSLFRSAGLDPRWRRHCLESLWMCIADN